MDQEQRSQIERQSEQQAEIARIIHACPEGTPEAIALMKSLEGTSLSGLLDDLVVLLRRYVVFANRSQAVAVTLWIAHTYIINQADATPYLAITSAEKRSGKSRLLDILELLVAKPWRAILPSEAVLYRQVDKVQPTLLLDEIDALYGKRNARDYEPQRALLNAGNRKGTKVPRCVTKGKEITVQEFGVYCAKALAGIGSLPDTVADRSIPIRLMRRAPNEEVKRFRYREALEDAEPLREKLEAWAGAIDLSSARPKIPEALDDRAADGWEPILAIADEAQGLWPDDARKAAVALHDAEGGSDKASLGLRLLGDIRAVFEGRGKAAVFTAELLQELNELEEAPWGDGAWDVKRGKALTARSLARLLRPYGIKPSGTVRIGNETAKGYYRAVFTDAWTRYLPRPLETAFDTSHRNNGGNSEGCDDFRLEPENQTSRENLSDFAACDGVTDETAYEGEGGA